MHWALVVLVATLGSEPERAPALEELIPQLGAARYADRQAATEAIESIGGPALPSLREATRADDPEVRSRAEWLVTRVETVEMTRPWRVSPDFANQTLDAIVAESEARWPCRLAWGEKVPEDTRRRRVTLRSEAPLPFWEVVDRLCEAGALHVVPGSPRGEGDAKPPQFRLFLAAGREGRPHADQGPLRLEVESVSHDRAAGFGAFDNLRRPGQPARPPMGDRQGRVGWRLRLRLLAEPRLLIDRHGQIEVHEAVDDRGQSLLPPGEGPRLGYSGSDFVPAQAAISIGLGMPLVRPEMPGTKIARLRLTVPVAVLSRRPNPMVVPLVGTVGQTFHQGNTTVSWLGASQDNQGHTLIAFRIRSEAYVPVNPGENEAAVWRPVRPEVTPSFVQVFDAQGRQFPWFGGIDDDNNNDEAQDALAKLTLWPEGGLPVPEATDGPLVPPEAKPTAVPTTLHVYDPARTVIRATFTLTDIPLPRESSGE